MKKKSQISKNPTLEGLILSQSKPEAGISILIYGAEKEKDSQQHPLVGNPSHPRSPGHCASHEHLPRLDTIIFSATNLSAGLKIFTAIMQASTSPNPSALP